MAPKTRYKDGLVRCRGCKTFLSPDCFHRNSPARTIRAGSEYRDQCKECERESSRKRHIKRRYGITEEQKYERISEQDNKCAVCSREFTKTGRTRPCIDHCHTTNKVRDILCDRCNSALGWVQEDIELCENLIAYIRKHK